MRAKNKRQGREGTISGKRREGVDRLTDRPHETLANGAATLSVPSL